MHVVISEIITFCVITLCVRKVITICVERLLHFALKILLHFASMLLHFTLVLHFAAILITFCGVTLANGGNIAVADHNGIVNGSYSLLKHFDIKLNGKKVYDCKDANHAVNIKNLPEYSPSYADKTATNEFFYLDTSRNAEEREFEVSGTNQLAKRRAEYNKGFALRKALLGVSSTVNTEILLNRYSFFEMLEDELLPNTRVEMNFEIESDGNLIWQAGPRANHPI